MPVDPEIMLLGDLSRTVLQFWEQIFNYDGLHPSIF